MQALPDWEGFPDRRGGPPTSIENPFRRHGDADATLVRRVRSEAIWTPGAFQNARSGAGVGESNDRTISLTTAHRNMVLK